MQATAGTLLCSTVILDYTHSASNKQNLWYVRMASITVIKEQEHDFMHTFVRKIINTRGDIYMITQCGARRQMVSDSWLVL